MGYVPIDADMKIKQLIPIDPDMIPLIKCVIDDDDDDIGEHEEYIDAIVYGWGVYYALFSEKEEFDGGISTSDVAFYTIPPDCFDSGFESPDEVKLVPKYTCDNCHNRMTPSICNATNKNNSWILYRCPVCNREFEMMLQEPTKRMKFT